MDFALESNDSLPKAFSHFHMMSRNIFQFAFRNQSYLIDLCRFSWYQKINPIFRRIEVLTVVALVN
jgi:hypothetical protein